jgi:hypothetical protein
MIRQLFVSLPVADVDRARRFFTALGLGFDPKFSGANAACLQLSDQVSVMLLARPFFEGLAHKPTADPMSTTQHLFAPVVGSREAVDDLHRRAVEAGGTSAGDADDHGFMYQRGFHDPDGHPWAITWMDPAGMPDPAG